MQFDQLRFLGITERRKKIKDDFINLLCQAFQEHGYTKKWKQREAVI